MHMTNLWNQYLGFFKAAFLSLLRTPSAWVFGFAFPVLFVIAFGFITNNSQVQVNLGVVFDDSDLYSQVVSGIENTEVFTLSEVNQEGELEKLLEDGDIDGIIKIQKTDLIELTINPKKPENISVIQQFLNDLNNQITLQKNGITESEFTLDIVESDPREIRYIDFVLPGILGYSLMSSAIFGVSFSFVSLKKNQVLKRIFAAPASQLAFVLGQASSRLIYILLQNIALLLVALALFRYIPYNGVLSFLEILALIVVGLGVFLGFGYFVASVTENDDAVAPIANLIVFPQLILAGTFFPVENLPTWLSNFAKILPLYHFNQAVRLVSLDGFRLWQVEVVVPVLILLVWGVLAYGVTARFFKLK
jgi:ABC-2 type transport system permease protein